LLALTCNSAFADESPVNITAVETPDLRLYYYNYLADIAPLAIRTFTNAREWQRRMFGWMPSERTTVILQDLADYGNAHAFAAHHDHAHRHAAIPRVRDEPGGRACIMTMNHELVHVRRATSVGRGPALAAVLLGVSRNRATGDPAHSTSPRRDYRPAR
jgi:hypothetical protein